MNDGTRKSTAIDRLLESRCYRWGRWRSVQNAFMEEFMGRTNSLQ